MARPSGRLELRRRAGGLVQRRQRATGSSDRIAAVWMGARHAGNVLRGAAAGSAMDGSVVARGEVRAVMRYFKGAIALSQTQDLPLLRQVMYSKYVTQTQLWQFMRHSGYESTRASPTP